MLPAVAWQFGQLGWFTIGAALSPMAAVLQIAPDIVILGGLLLWFYLSQGRIAAWCLVAYQGLSVLVNAWDFLHWPMQSDHAKALVTHIVWRVAAIVLLVLFIRRPAPVDVEAAAKTFE